MARFRKRRRFGTKKVGKLSRLVKRVARRQAMNRPEMKSVTIDVSDSSFSAGDIALLSSIAGGTLNNQRIGSVVSVHAIQWKMKYTANFSTTSIVGARMMIFIDKQQVLATTPTSIQLLSSPSDGVLSLHTYASKAEGKRFRWITDKHTDLQGVATAGNHPNRRWFTGFKKLHGMRVSFTDGSGSNINKNGIYMWQGHESTTGTIISDGYVRIWYTDS